MVTTFLGGLASGAGFAIGMGGVAYAASKRRKKQEKKNPARHVKRGRKRRKARR